MPGESDAANAALPQQPLHPCLFPAAGRAPTFMRVTNPHAFTLAGIEVREGGP